MKQRVLMHSGHRAWAGNRSAGFTLVEILVALAILTLVVTSVAWTLHTKSRALEMSHTRALQTSELRSAADFMRRNFAQLPPVFVRDGRDKRPVFRGQQHLLSFVAPAPIFSDSAGLLVYALAIADSGDGKALLLNYSPFDAGAPRIQEVDFSGQVVLAEGFEEVSFRYFGAPTEEASATWSDSWPARSTLFPRAIRLVTTMQPGRADWPDMTFLVRTAGAGQ